VACGTRRRLAPYQRVLNRPDLAISQALLQRDICALSVAAAAQRSSLWRDPPPSVTQLHFQLDELNGV
jgi:hypothetical protein